MREWRPPCEIWQADQHPFCQHPLLVLNEVILVSLRKLILRMSNVCNFSTPERLQHGKSASGHQPGEQDVAGKHLVGCKWTKVKTDHEECNQSRVLTWPGDINSLMTLLTTSDAGKKSMRTYFQNSAQRNQTSSSNETWGRISASNCA